ncbi:Pkinase-domain-containing protein [Calocera viscosa TUFC12733]|uniref:non-specific serine/threonine protein kinase n=1 Tax=Calocera viscosa (strain TUFC12733) TaxID=1330018 RepID=A0A167PG17_CALVF|nr:Pkinase-domain-containing protein [Calocera viscosa TUFC12733]
MPELPLAPTEKPVTSVFRKLELVGRGGFGTVHRGIHIESGSIVALKIINLDKADDDVDDIQREIALLSRLRGGAQYNVTRYWGCWLEDTKVWIAMDYAAGGSLTTLMKAGLIEERYTAVVVRETLIGLSYLHRENVIHRDIKAANILLTSRGHVMLIDFGVSALLASKDDKRMTLIGTPHYIAPEVIRSTSSYNTKADIWSLGITIYELATGEPPHSVVRDVEQAFAAISKQSPPVLPPKAGSEAMREFVEACLMEKPSDRPTADDLLKHKWLKPFLKRPVSVLTELIKRYKDWEEKGGVRNSMIELDDKRDTSDDGDLLSFDRPISTWEFESTLRLQHIGLSALVDKDDIEMPTGTNSNASNSLSRVAPLFARKLFSEHAEPPPPPDDMMRSPPSRRRQPTPQPFLGEPLRTESPRPLDGPTVKPVNFSFPPKPPGAHPMPTPTASDEQFRSATPTATTSRSASPNVMRSHSPLPSEPPPQIRRSPKSRSNSPPASPQSTLRNKRRAATLDSKIADPPTLSLPQSQPVVTSPSRPVMAPGWSFPSVPESAAPGRPRAPSDSAPPPRDVQISGSAPPLPPPLLRANSAMPWTTLQPTSESTESLVSSPATPTRNLGPRRPSLARLGSAMAVMETAPGTPGPSPMPSIGALLAISDPAEGKDGKMPPLTPPKPDFANSDPDFLPPSPTMTSHPFPLHSTPQGSTSLNTSQLTVSTTNSSSPFSARPSRNNSTSAFATPASPFPSHLPLQKPLGLPPVRLLDYRQLGTSEAIHAELAKTVESLRDWMGLVEHALAGVLDFKHGLREIVDIQG